MNIFMKIFAILFIGWTISLIINTEANAQSKARKKINTEHAVFVSKVDGFNLIWYDTQGQMDIHDTMKKIDPTHNPKLIIILDEELGKAKGSLSSWRLATSLQEASRMPDKSKVVQDFYENVLPYKRTGYID